MAEKCKGRFAFLRIICFILFPLFLLCAAVIFGTEAAALTAEEAEERLLSDIGKEAELPEGIGETEDPEGVLWQIAGSSFRQVLSDGKAFALAALALLLLSALLRSAAGAVGREAERVASLLSLLLLGCGAGKELLGAVELGKTALLRMTAVSGAALPAVSAVQLARGQFTSAAARSAGVSLLCTLTAAVGGKILTPLLSVCIGFSLLSVLWEGGEGESLSGLGGQVKKITLTLFSLFGFLFTLILFLQVKKGKAADEVLIKTLQFASGSIIPVVGSALGGSAEAVTAELSYLCSRIGGLAVICLVSALLYPILRILLLRCLFSLLSVAAGLLGCHREAKLLTECGEIAGLLSGILAIGSTLFIFALAVV